MSYRRPPHHSAEAGPPLGSVPDELGDQDSQVVGLFVAGPIGALVGRVLAVSMKNAGVGTISPLGFKAVTPQAKPPASSPAPAKKSKPKPAAGGKSPVRKRRKRRRS